MTISATATSVQYVRNGTTLQWSFPNKVFAAADVIVTDLDASSPPVQTLLVLNTDYTIANVDVDTGCLINTTLPGIAGHTLDIRTAITELQTTSIKNQGAFLPELHEEAFDKLTRELQDLRRLVYTYGIHGPDIESVPWPALPAPANRKNNALMFDAITGLPTLGVPSTQTITTGLLAPFLSLDLSMAEILAGVTPIKLSYNPGDVRRYGADPTGATASDAAFASAEAVAFVGGFGKIYAPAGIYVLTGTLTLRSGVILAGDGSGSSEYYPSSPYNTVQVTQIWKQTTGANGPLFIMQTASQIRGVYLRIDKVGGSATGVIQIGTVSHASLNDSTHNVEIDNVSIYGTAIVSTALVDNTGVALYFYDGSVANTTQRYGCRFRGVRIQNFWTAVSLGENCNQNNFTGLIIRQTYLPVVLNGGAGGACLENTFAAMNFYNIGVLPTSPCVVFTLKNGAVNNNFTGYATECNGSAFSIDATCVNNTFIGYENEATPTYVPAGNNHSLWAQPRNRSQTASMLLPAPGSVAGTAYTNGLGNKITLYSACTGSLPQLNSAGTVLVAADANSRRIALFPVSLYAKAQRPGMRCVLRVYVGTSGGGLGEGIVEVEFWYRVTDNSTNAASLTVVSVTSQPAVNYIKGLKFLTGVASGNGFGIALVGGVAGAISATHVIVSLDIEVFTHDTNIVPMANYESITFVSTACTANDVTDSIDLLTVASTVI